MHPVQDYFMTQPEHLRFQWHKKGIDLATVTSKCVSGSQSISHRHSSYKVLAYPSFSGYAKGWIEFERDFQGNATAQGFGYILQIEVKFSTTAFGQSNYIFGIQPSSTMSLSIAGLIPQAPAL